MKTFTTYAEKKAKQFLNLLQGYTKGIRITAILILLLLGVSNAWGLGYNNESHVYLDVNGTTKYYKVSSESWSTGCSLPGTWGGELKNQTFNDVQNLTIKGGAVGGWTNSGEKLSATLSYAVTTNTNTPSSWTNFGSVSSNHTTYNGNNAFYYKNDGSTDVTPTTPGTYYLHIKIAFNSTSKTSYAKFTIPEPPTYTVAGSKEVLGSDWDETDTNNDMTLSSGTIYTLTKQDVSLTKGANYECKVVQNHDWNKAWPNNNYSFSVQTTGHYDVTFTFNSSTKTIDVATTRLYALTYDGNGNTSGSVPTTTKYHKDGTNITVANNSGNLAKSGYTFEGWNDKTDGTGTSYAAGSTFVMPDADKTLYAKWTEKTYSVTISAGAGGTVSPSGSKTIGQVTKTTVTATPNANYEFVNWTATGGVVVENTSSASTTITATAAGTLKANFRSTATYALTVKAGTGIQSVTGSKDPVTLGSSYSITATPKTGYSFSQWTAEPAANATFASATSANTNVTIKNGSVTVTATATENTYTVTVNSSNDNHGTVTQSATKAGIATTITITATPKDGYKFVNWTTQDAGITIADAESATTTVTATATGTVTANFEEIPKETIYFVNKDSWSKVKVHLWNGTAAGTTWPGIDATKADFQLNCLDVYYVSAPAGSYKNCIFSNNGSNQTADLTWTADKYFYDGDWKTLDYFKKEVKLAGSMNNWTAESLNMSVGYSEGSLTVALDANQTYEFKIIVDGAWHGNNETMTYGNSTDWTMSTSVGDNCKITTAGAGDYTFTYDVCTAKLTVTYPTSYKVTYSRTPTAAASAPTTSPSVTSGKYVAAGTSVTFTAQNAKTGYTWKGWYDNSEGTGAALSTNKAYTRTINADTKIYAVYTLNTYSVAIVADPAEAAETLTSSPQTVGVNQVNISTTAKFTYKFDNWTATEGITITDASNPSTSITASKAGTVTAHFTKMQPTTVYLKPNENWKQADARFAIHYWHDGQPAGWVDMTDAGCNRDYFVGVIPAGYTNFLFARMDPNNLENKWDAEIDWNKTGDLTVPTDGKNLFTLPSTGDAAWNGATTTWGTYTPPTYTININAPESGSIAVTVGGNTTTVTTTPTQIKNIALGTTFTIAYTPNAGFALGHSEVDGIKETYAGAGTYTVCGPVDITAHFITSKEQVVYLRPNDNWLADNALFYAYAFNRYGDNKWIELTTKETDYTGAFGGTIPAGYSDVIFVRLNPNGTDNANNKINFTNAWNQSIDYPLPTDDTNNRFIIGEKVTSGSDKDKYKGSWEVSKTPIYGIPGDWQTDTWAADEYPLMGPDGKVTVNITQTNDTLGFKVYHYPYGSDNNSDQWFGNNGTMVRGGEGVHEGGWIMETNTNNNCGLGVDIAGDYVFAFNIRNKKLTVAYPALPTPAIRITSEERVYEDLTDLRWVGGAGLEDKPYQLYADEAARITVSPLPEVEGLTAYYQFGENPEQESNVFDWKGISTTTATAITVKAYYKNTNGATSEHSTVNTSFFQAIKLPFNLMTDPRNEINVDRIVAGENILVQFRSDSKATVTLSVTDLKTETTTVLKKIENSISYDYTYDVPDNTTPRILRFTAKAASPVNGRYLECSADVAIYKNVIIKVNDPEGWVKNAYMWRDYSDAVKTQWPGEPVLQNFGTWRVFSVKYPYFDRFIVNDGKAEGATQTIDYVLPADDTCYELLDPANNGSDKEEDKHKYGLKVADCPGNLMVNGIKDTTLMEGEQIVVMPEVFVGLGYKLSDVEITHLNADNPSSVRVMQSGNNIIVSGYGIGSSNVTVSFTLGAETITKTFTVTVVKNTHITIQVKVPVNFGDGNDYQWKDGTKIGIRYWGTGINGTDLTMDYAYTDATYHYAQAQLPLGTDDKIDFHFYYERHSDENAKWRQSSNVTATVSGCYTLAQGSDYYRRATRNGDYCFDDTNYAQYQVKVFLPIAGKEYSSNIVTNTIDTLSFFAPGQNETGYRAGTVQLYKNGKMVAAINPTMFAESNVYTATVNETGDGLGNVAPYSGNFYIRTWGTDGDINNQGWDSPKTWNDTQKAARKFTYFISRENEFYNHYWVQAMNTGGYDGKDVSACVANDYNDDLAGKLTKGKGTNEDGDIKVGTNTVINVRFGYDPRTNYFGRAIIKGSANDTYLNIHCDNAYKDKNCSPEQQLPYGTSNSDNRMQDISNWVYQLDFYVPIDNNHPSASLYVEATSPSTEMTVTDHLLGYVTNEVTGEEDHTKPVQRTIIGSGTNNGTYLMRVVYDFKTNRIIAAWLPQGTVDVTDPLTLHSDVLFVRKENEEVPQINLSKNGEIRSLESMFFAIELERGDTDKNNRHQEQYWFTLPFDCVVGSISGVPGYMQTWGIQRYRGDLRAAKGWYAETPTFWEWLTINDVLHAGEGYLLVFDKKAAPWEEIEVDKYDADGHIMQDENGNNIKENISMMRLYFPSTTVGFDMQQQSAEHLTRTYENHTCTLTLHNRYLQDSNWKVIGTTSYNNAGITGYTKDYNPEYEELSEAPSFRYQYEYTMSNDNKSFWYKYTPEDGKTATYQSFYGYMVQFAGTINWQPIMSETVPEGIAARRYVPANERTSFTTRLELANADGEKQDQTFVALDEKATITFDQNKDLNKVINAGTNIYTLSEGIPFAGNTLPMAKTTVPVGVRIATAGEYTFRMPDGTDGIAVTLVDNATGTHTNMLMSEYTVTLNAGTIENRFYLIVDPDRAATSVENVGNEAQGDEVNGNDATGVKKYIIDGRLIIRTNGNTFDAQGHKL